MHENWNHGSGPGRKNCRFEGCNGVMSHPTQLQCRRLLKRKKVTCCLCLWPAQLLKVTSDLWCCCRVLCGRWEHTLQNFLKQSFWESRAYSSITISLCCLPMLLNLKDLLKNLYSHQQKSLIRSWGICWRLVKVFWPSTLVADEEAKQICPWWIVSLNERARLDAFPPFWSKEKLQWEMKWWVQHFVKVGGFGVCYFPTETTVTWSVDIHFTSRCVGMCLA